MRGRIDLSIYGNVNSVTCSHSQVKDQGDELQLMLNLSKYSSSIFSVREDF